LAQRFPVASPSAAGVPFSVLLDGVERERSLRPATIRGYRSHVSEFVRFVEHDDASRVTADDVLRWKDHLVGAGELDSKTINEGRLASLSAVMGWGQENRKLKSNPAKGVRVKAKKRPRTRSKGLSEEEAKTILRASLKVGTLEEQLVRRHKAARRWIPWLCCYSGARVTEIAQLRGSDIKQEAGVWFMVLTPEAGSIKSDEFRIVPLHPHLIEQGFLEFVKNAGQGPLFYDRARGRKATPNKSHPRRSAPSSPRG
jgi:integrase